KVARDGRSATAAAFDREAAVLAHLDGDVAPRLVAAGEQGGRRYLAVEWCAGLDADAAARELREGDAAPGGRRAGRLARRRGIPGGSARLHARGIVHGDVHARNVLVGAEGEIRLIDFGLAAPVGAAGGLAALSMPSALAGAERGGVGFFFEPEY